MSFAVVDFETTGIVPAMNHRVIEVGVTHVDAEGRITGSWETVVNPQRDLGPQHIHGLRAAEILDAPLFSDIAGDFVGLLSGRAFVAHNASFDTRFLVAEFERMGFDVGGNIPHLCTRQTARNFSIPGEETLQNCCAHFGISIANAHSAGADSVATAQLLSAYIKNSLHIEEWRQYWNQILLYGTSFRYPSITPSGVRWKPRQMQFSVQENTPSSALPTNFVLLPGDHVVLTGDMKIGREAWEEKLSSLGYVPRPTVTKKTKLLIAADVDSLSGKARKAREYFVPIVNEDWLINFLNA